MNSNMERKEQRMLTLLADARAFREQLVKRKARSGAQKSYKVPVGWEHQAIVPAFDPTASPKKVRELRSGERVPQVAQTDATPVCSASGHGTQSPTGLKSDDRGGKKKTLCTRHAGKCLPASRHTVTSFAPYESLDQPCPEMFMPTVAALFKERVLNNMCASEVAELRRRWRHTLSNEDKDDSDEGFIRALRGHLQTQVRQFTHALHRYCRSDGFSADQPVAQSADAPRTLPDHPYGPLVVGNPTYPEDKAAATLGRGMRRRKPAENPNADNRGASANARSADGGARVVALDDDDLMGVGQDGGSSRRTNAPKSKKSQRTHLRTLSEFVRGRVSDTVEGCVLSIGRAHGLGAKRNGNGNGDSRKQSEKSLSATAAPPAAPAPTDEAVFFAENLDLFPTSCPPSGAKCVGRSSLNFEQEFAQHEMRITGMIVVEKEEQPSGQGHDAGSAGQTTQHDGDQGDGDYQEDFGSSSSDQENESSSGSDSSSSDDERSGDESSSSASDGSDGNSSDADVRMGAGHGVIRADPVSLGAASVLGGGADGSPDYNQVTVTDTAGQSAVLAHLCSCCVRQTARSAHKSRQRRIASSHHGRVMALFAALQRRLVDQIESIDERDSTPAPARRGSADRTMDAKDEGTTAPHPPSRNVKLWTVQSRPPPASQLPYDCRYNTWHHAEDEPNRLGFVSLPFHRAALHMAARDHFFMTTRCPDAHRHHAIAECVDKGSIVQHQAEEPLVKPRHVNRLGTDWEGDYGGPDACAVDLAHCKSISGGVDTEDVPLVVPGQALSSSVQDPYQPAFLPPLPWLPQRAERRQTITRAHAMHALHQMAVHQVAATIFRTPGAVAESSGNAESGSAGGHKSQADAEGPASPEASNNDADSRTARESPSNCDGDELPDRNGADTANGANTVNLFPVWMLSHLWEASSLDREFSRLPVGLEHAKLHSDRHTQGYHAVSLRAFGQRQMDLQRAGKSQFGEGDGMDEESDDEGRQWQFRVTLSGVDEGSTPPTVSTQQRTTSQGQPGSMECAEPSNTDRQDATCVGAVGGLVAEPLPASAACILDKNSPSDDVNASAADQSGKEDQPMHDESVPIVDSGDTLSIGESSGAVDMGPSGSPPPSVLAASMAATETVLVTPVEDVTPSDGTQTETLFATHVNEQFPRAEFDFFLSAGTSWNPHVLRRLRNGGFASHLPVSMGWWDGYVEAPMAAMGPIVHRRCDEHSDSDDHTPGNDSRQCGGGSSADRAAVFFLNRPMFPAVSELMRWAVEEQCVRKVLLLHTALNGGFLGAVSALMTRIDAQIPQDWSAASPQLRALFQILIGAEYAHLYACCSHRNRFACVAPRLVSLERIGELCVKVAAADPSWEHVSLQFDPHGDLVMVLSTPQHAESERFVVMNGGYCKLGSSPLTSDWTVATGRDPCRHDMLLSLVHHRQRNKLAARVLRSCESLVAFHTAQQDTQRHTESSKTRGNKPHGWPLEAGSLKQRLLSACQCSGSADAFAQRFLVPEGCLELQDPWPQMTHHHRLPRGSDRWKDPGGVMVVANIPSDMRKSPSGHSSQASDGRPSDDKEQLAKDNSIGDDAGLRIAFCHTVADRGNCQAIDRQFSVQARMRRSMKSNSALTSTERRQLEEEVKQAKIDYETLSSGSRSRTKTYMELTSTRADLADCLRDEGRSVLSHALGMSDQEIAQLKTMSQSHAYSNRVLQSRAEMDKLRENIAEVIEKRPLVGRKRSRASTATTGDATEGSAKRRAVSAKPQQKNPKREAREVVIVQESDLVPTVEVFVPPVSRSFTSRGVFRLVVDKVYKELLGDAFDS